MCGLFGVASSEGRKEEYSRKSAFQQGLQMQEWRGKDATGVALIKLKDTKEQPFVYKKALRASDFVQLQVYDRSVNFKFDEYAFVIGHARSATSGRGDSDRDYNAHPFNQGHVTLAHNGHIRNYHALEGGADVQVDSAHVAGALSNATEAKEVLEKLEGGFALVWHDTRDGSLNFARNNERPLWWCYAEKENTMFWGSELEAIYAVLRRNFIKIDGKFRHCTAYNHFKFDIKDLREFTRIPFAQRPPTPTSTASGSGWKEGVRRLPGGNGTTTSHFTRKNENTNTGTVLHLATLSERMESPLIRTVTTELQEELEKEEQTSASTPKDRPCRPTSTKKLRKVKQQLHALNVKLDSVRCFTPTGFREYKNQDPKRGAIYGKDRVKGMNFEIPNCLYSLWCTVRGKKMYGRISNVTSELDGSKTVIMDFAEDMQERFIDRYSKARLESDIKKSTYNEEIEDSDLRTVDGPMGHQILESEFKERTRHGCSNCSTDIPVEDAKVVVWAGQLGQYPICGSCAKDPQISEMFASVQGGI